MGWDSPANYAKQICLCFPESQEHEQCIAANSFSWLRLSLLPLVMDEFSLQTAVIHLKANQPHQIT